VSERELPGEAVDQVQAHGQDDVDPGEDEDARDVLVDQMREQAVTEDEDAEDGDDTQGPAR
jgi:hypothetical protein